MGNKILSFSITILFLLIMINPVHSSITGINNKNQIYNNFKINNLDFDQKINFYMNLAHMPSFSTCILKNDDVVWSNNYGYYDLKNSKIASNDTVYMFASISKMITAIAIMQLYERGLFDLDENINNYLPFNVYNPNFPTINITFRMLLAHQSSLNDGGYRLYFYYSILGYQNDWLDELLIEGGLFYSPTIWKNYPPGDDHIYSNTGYALLGYLVEIISDQLFDEYCYQNIFKPLEMNNTNFQLSYFDRDKIAIPYIFTLGAYIPLPLYELKHNAVAGIKSTICDLSHFLIVHLNDGIYKEVQILKKETMELMQKIQYENGSDGFAWKFVEFPDGKIYLGHAGILPGYRSQIWIYPPDSSGIVYVYNQNHGLDIRENFRLVGFLEKYARIKIEQLLFEKINSNSK